MLYKERNIDCYTLSSTNNTDGLCMETLLPKRMSGLYFTHITCGCEHHKHKTMLLENMVFNFWIKGSTLQLMVSLRI